MRLSIIGTGAWGTALAIVTQKMGHEVTLWARRREIAEEICSRHTLAYLPGIRIDPDIRATDDLAEALSSAEWVVLATPSHGMRAVAGKIQPLLGNRPVICVTKGIDMENQKRLSEVAFEVLGNIRYAVLSGPSFAHDVAQSKPTALVAASTDVTWSEEIQRKLSGPMFRLYTSDDVTGVELGGAMKNVIAIAAGVSDGLGLGESSRAALITRGLAEIVRVGESLGGRRETFFGLSGLGDLVLTCGGRLSRNHHAGEELARGKTLDQIVASMNGVAEGIRNSECFFRIVSSRQLDAPVIRETYSMLYEGVKPVQALENLMKRELKRENAS